MILLKRCLQSAALGLLPSVQCTPQRFGPCTYVRQHPGSREKPTAPLKLNSNVLVAAFVDKTRRSARGTHLR